MPALVVPVAVPVVPGLLDVYLLDLLHDQDGGRCGRRVPARGHRVEVDQGAGAVRFDDHCGGRSVDGLSLTAG